MKAPILMIRSFLACSLVSFTLCGAAWARAADPAPADITAALRRSADWHLANPSGIDTRDWVIAPLHKQMTGAILAAQQLDGLWRPSLLDPDQVPIGETSGSGFFVFGLAWGVNHGLLDRAAHSWRRLFDTPLFEGEGECSAYSSGPALGPDGYFHGLWR